MRFVFLDESGISAKEPRVVVAGVIVEGDRQVIQLEDHLAALAEKHIPENQREGFVFHTMEIWSGTGIFKDRDRWPLSKRINILYDLVRIPRRLEIPIIYYVTEKEGVQFEGDGVDKMTLNDKTIAYHGMAFTGCTLRIEQQMREVWPDEIAQLVAEDNEQARKTIKRAHEIIRHPRWLSQNNFEGLDTLPLKRIRGAVHFASKSESGPLQLADVCAFFIRAHLSGKQDAYWFYRPLRKWMLLLPKQAPQWEGSGRFVEPWWVSLP